MPAVDGAFGDQINQYTPWLSTTPAAAGRTLSAFGGAIATATGVVFSTVIVVLSLASQQYGPRLLRTFLADATTQFSLGAFVGTSLYTLLVMRVIREVEGNPVAPDLSVWVAIVLSILTFGQLVYFIHHIARSIQAPRIIKAVADDLDAAIERLFPERVGEPVANTPGKPQTPLAGLDREIASVDEGYLQAVDSDRLMSLAVEHDLYLSLPRRPGDFLARGDLVAKARPAARLDDGIASELAECFLLGTRRTPRQDVECAIYELVEVAVRALSPGINDPFTAMSCLDYLGAALSRLAERRLPDSNRYDEGGRLRVTLERPPSFDSALNAAFDQIRQAGDGHVDVMIRAALALGRVSRAASDDDQRAVVRRQTQMLRRAAEKIAEPNDREDLLIQIADAESCLNPPPPSTDVAFAGEGLGS